MVDVRHAATEQGQGSGGSSNRRYGDPPPAWPGGRGELDGEAISAEPRSALYHVGAIGDGTLRPIGDGIQCPLPQVSRCQRRREQAGQYGRPVDAAGLDAYLAAPDVPLHPPAQQPSTFPAPAGEDSPEFRAVLELGYDYRQRFQ